MSTQAQTNFQDAAIARSIEPMWLSLRSLLILLATCASGFASNVALATELNIEDYRWNLDGVGRFEEFNQLTLQVTNQSSADFDGDLEFIQGGLIAPTAVLRQPLFLAKGQSTRVVFDVYFSSYIEAETYIRWGRRDDQIFDVVSPDGIWSWKSVPAAKEARELPPVAWLSASDRATSPGTGGAIREMAPRWVPISAAALPTDSVVALSSDPPIQPAQRQALADWVKMGGTMYLFRDGDSYDQFSGELAFLNLAMPRQAVGRGLVVRDRRNFTQLDAEDWRDMSRKAHTGLGSLITEDEHSYMYNQLQNGFSDGIYQAFSLIHRPEVSWPLVFTLFFIYIAAILFGGIFVSKKTRDWKATYATLALLIGLFSVLFWYIGARGHGEQSEAMTLAVVDVVDADSSAGRGRVRAWTQFFSTSSGVFDLKPIAGRVGFRPRETGGRELIYDGAEGVYRRRVPVFSAASFQWQGITEMTTPQVLSATFDEQSREARLDIDGLVGNVQLQLFVNGQETSLAKRDDGYHSGGWSSVTVDQALDPEPHSLRWSLRNTSGREQVRQRILVDCDAWLRQYCGYTNEQAGSVVETAGVLVVIGDLPDALKSSFGDGVLESGRVLYRIPVRFHSAPQSESPADNDAEVSRVETQTPHSIESSS